MWHFDDQDRGEWLPCQLCDRSDRADQGVFIVDEVGVLLESKYRAISENRFVENLKEEISANVSTKQSVKHIPEGSKPRQECLG